MRSRALVAGCVVATIAFAAYTRTLLPGVDLGDSGGFQAAVLWPEISARQAYPLYYALAKPFVAALSPDLPARGLNLFSAVFAAAAAGLLCGVVAAVTQSIAGGAVAGLLLAFSYTFWTQAIIAEVYSLHLAIVGCCLVALVAWWRRPTTTRLAACLAIYALGFGNHLSMILLLVPFAVFAVMTAKQPRDVLRPSVVALGVCIAAVAALQYLPQAVTLWTSLDAPERWTDRLAAFWFDATKSDWRESMVLGVGGTDLMSRIAMVGFDARQQFGIAGLALAVAGLFALWRASRPWAALVILAYAINTVFAFTYNVGDPHVFFLPGHFFAAFAAGAAVAGVTRLRGAWRPMGTGLAALAIVYAAWRGYDTWPAADRHLDRRAEQLVNRFTAGLDERTDLLAAEMNWQVENALLYETRYRLPRIVWTRLSDVLLYFPLLVRDNHAGARDVVLTARAAASVAGAFGPLMPIVLDPIPPAPPLASYAARIRRGAPYVLAILTPTRDEALDLGQVNEALRALTGGRASAQGNQAYEIFVGRAGQAPLFHRSASRPFRQRVRLPEGILEIRIDGFVPIETFRRGGFGHVLLNRTRMLALERGVSVGALGMPDAFYASGIYALQPRFRIPAGGLPELALLH